MKNTQNVGQHPHIVRHCSQLQIMKFCLIKGLGKDMTKSIKNNHYTSANDKILVVLNIWLGSKYNSAGIL